MSYSPDMGYYTLFSAQLPTEAPIIGEQSHTASDIMNLETRTMIKKADIQKFIYRARHHYLTFNNAVILVAFLIALGWLWGSLQVMQRNYVLQREVDNKQRELVVTRLQKDNLELQKRFYQTNEYKEMAARESLGLVMPGERVLILPGNTEAVKQADKDSGRTIVLSETPERVAGNFEQWMNFLFGGYSRSMQASEDK